MRILYSVQGKTRIGRNSPGYFSVGFFEKREDAEEICNHLNKKLWNGEYKTTFNFTDDNPFAYGYEEGLSKDYVSDNYFFIQVVRIPDNAGEWFDKVEILSKNH